MERICPDAVCGLCGGESSVRSMGVVGVSRIGAFEDVRAVQRPRFMVSTSSSLQDSQSIAVGMVLARRVGGGVSMVAVAVAGVGAGVGGGGGVGVGQGGCRCGRGWLQNIGE